MLWFGGIIPENQKIAVIDGKVYTRRPSDVLPWVRIDGLDERSINVLSTIAKLQQAGANIS